MDKKQWLKVGGFILVAGAAFAFHTYNTIKKLEAERDVITLNEIDPAKVTIEDIPSNLE